MTRNHSSACSVGRPALGWSRRPESVLATSTGELVCKRRTTSEASLSSRRPSRPPSTRSSTSRSARGCHSGRNDQVDGDHHLAAVHLSRCQPDAGLFKSLECGKAKAGRFHQLAEGRSVLEQLRVDRQIAVGRVLGDPQTRGAGAKVDRLGACEYHSGSVATECVQRVEQDPSSLDVLRREIFRRNQGRSAPSESARHSDSLACIHSSSASPSAGIRPLPVRQSTTTWEGAA